MNTITRFAAVGALFGALVAGAPLPAAGQGAMLDGYKLVKGPVVPTNVTDNLSGLTYDAGRGTLLAILNKPTRIVELDREGAVLGTFELPGFEDTEDLASMGGGKVAVIEERRRVLSVCELPVATGEIPRPAGGVLVEAQSYENVGLEGVAYDAAGGRFFVVKEKDPRRIYAVKPGATEGGVTHPWDLQAAGFGLSDISAVAYVPASGHLLLLSDESRCIVECTVEGLEIGRLPLTAGNAGLTEDIKQAEGLALDAQDRLYIVAEPNQFYIFDK